MKLIEGTTNKEFFELGDKSPVCCFIAALATK